MGWRHSKEANSSPLFKAICDKRIMISVANALLKNKKDKTLTVEQQDDIQEYYKKHTDIPVGNAAIFYFRYLKDFLAAGSNGVVSDKVLKSALKMYAINSWQRFLPEQEADDLRNLIVTNKANRLHFEYKLLQNAIASQNTLLCKLVGIALMLK